jgi:hypothetical protein
MILSKQSSHFMILPPLSWTFFFFCICYTASLLAMFKMISLSWNFYWFQITYPAPRSICITYVLRKLQLTEAKRLSNPAPCFPGGKTGSGKLVHSAIQPIFYCGLSALLCLLQQMAAWVTEPALPHPQFPHPWIQPTWASTNHQWKSFKKLYLYWT